MSAESEGISEHIVHIFFHRRTYRIVQVALRIYVLCPNCLMDKSVFNTLYTNNKFMDFVEFTTTSFAASPSANLIAFVSNRSL